MKRLMVLSAALSLCAAAYAGDVFEKITAIKREATAVASTGEAVYAAADDTLYRREVGDGWRRLASLARPQSRIRDVAVFGGTVYVAADDGVFKVGKGNALEKVFSQSASVDGAEADDSGGSVRFLALYADKETVWAGSDRGLFADAGAGFVRVAGIADEARVAALTGTAVAVFAATEKGVYRIDKATRRAERVTGGTDELSAATAGKQPSPG